MTTIAAASATTTGADSGGRLLRSAMVFACGLASVALFFRFQLLNGFTLLISDRFDGIIETTILEHWYNVLKGVSSFNDTLFFYPVRDALGYNDGYFLYGLIYSVFRRIGFDPFMAGESVDIAMVAIGYASFYLCGRRVVALGVGTSALFAGLFVLSGSLYIQAVHAQLLSVCLAPLLAVLIAEGCRAVAAGSFGRTLAYGGLAALLHATWLLTAFYMAWFFVFATLTLAAVALVAEWRHRGAVLSSLRAVRVALAIVLAFYAALDVPFVVVYLPKLVETGQHGIGEAFAFLPSPLDIFNVSPDNLIFGRLYGAASHWIRPGFTEYGEKATGFPPVLLFLFAVAALSSFRPWPGDRPAAMRLVTLIAWATLLSWLCVLRVRDLSAWTLIYHLVPGAKAVRVVARYQLFLSFPLLLVVASYVDTNYRRLVPSAWYIVAAVLVLEQIVMRPNVGLAAPLELGRLRAVPEPPASCRSFFAAAAREDPPSADITFQAYSHNVDAMMIAEYIGLPTLNGMATFLPRDWDLTRLADRAAYVTTVGRYVVQHGLTDVCSLDLRRMAWDTSPFLSAAPPFGGRPIEDRVCAGHIDVVGGADASAAAVQHGGLDVAGWVAASAADPEGPRAVAVELAGRDHDTRYVAAEIDDRPDVSEALGNPGLGRAGFGASVPVDPKGDYDLALLIDARTAVYRCTNLELHLTFD